MKTITEDQLKKALKDAIITYNKQLLESRTDEDKLIINKLLLNFVGNILYNLGIDYKKEC